MHRNRILSTIFIITGLFLVFLMLFYLKEKEKPEEEIKQEETTEPEEKSIYECAVVVVDPGHGGKDPGKVGTAGTLEKDINLLIAMELKPLLEEEGITVVMTREEDISLGNTEADNVKMEDLNERVRLIDESGCYLAVSIHQNSFQDKSVAGPQVFYYEGSEGGETAANVMQQALNRELSVQSPRSIKANGDYWLLKKTKATLVIAECAFLSNPEEEKLLNEEAYRDRIALALKEGILKYLDVSFSSEENVIY